MEFKSLAESCRHCFRAGNASARDFPVNTLNWPHFLQLARRHRVQGLASKGISIFVQDPPAEILRPLNEDAMAVVGQNLRMLSECAGLKGDFKDAGLPLLFLKGLTLAALVYREPMLKMAWDIDVLIAPGDLQEAARLLRKRGYDPTVPDSPQLNAWHERHKESIWRQAETGIHLELHTRLADNPHLIAGVGVWSPAQQIEVAAGIELPTLATEELFAYLSVHGASSAWFRLKWISDFAALIAAFSPSDFERLYERAQEIEAGRAPAQALLVADKLFDLQLPPDLRKRIDSDPANRALAWVAIRQVLEVREPTERPLGTATIHLSQGAMLPGLRFATDEYVRQLRDMLSR